VPDGPLPPAIRYQFEEHKMSCLFKLIAGVLLIVLVPSAWTASLNLWQYMWLSHRELLVIILGASVTGCLMGLAIFGASPWLSTFIHELAHCVASVSSLRRVTSMQVNPGGGGYMTYEGNAGGIAGTTFITMAPYLALLPVLAAWLKLYAQRAGWIDNPAPLYVNVLFGVVLGMTVAFVWKQLANNAFRQGDFTHAGPIFFCICALAVNIFCLCFSVALYAGQDSCNVFLESLCSSYRGLVQSGMTAAKESVGSLS
jgi:hypothetical protein